MSSKEKILNSIRSLDLPGSELPSLNGEWIQYHNPVEKFQEMVQFVGGRCVVVPSLIEADVDLSSESTYRNAHRVLSRVKGLGRNSVELDSITDPHDLDDLDYAIFPGDLAVAENGAVWVTDKDLRHRVAYFITQHLVLVVQKDRLLNNMYQAYEHLTFTSAQFGVFISGPSKTADIEQSLVIGAHGARSLTVYLVENMNLSHT